MLYVYWRLQKQDFRFAFCPFYDIFTAFFFAYKAVIHVRAVSGSFI